MVQMVPLEQQEPRANLALQGLLVKQAQWVLLGSRELQVLMDQRETEETLELVDFVDHQD